MDHDPARTGLAGIAQSFEPRLQFPCTAPPGGVGGLVYPPFAGIGAVHRLPYSARAAGMHYCPGMRSVETVNTGRETVGQCRMPSNRSAPAPRSVSPPLDSHTPQRTIGDIGTGMAGAAGSAAKDIDN